MDPVNGSTQNAGNAGTGTPAAAPAAGTSGGRVVEVAGKVQATVGVVDAALALGGHRTATIFTTQGNHRTPKEFWNQTDHRTVLQWLRGEPSRNSRNKK